MKIVITGGAGFIGSHIAGYWSNKNNTEVHIIDNLRTGYLKNIGKFNNLIFHKGSVTNKKLVFDVIQGADYVFHLAALVSVPESLERPKECVKININGLLNVLEASKNFGIKKVVFSSSAAIYGNNHKQPKNTDMKPDPKTPYAITKLDGEYYLQMFYNEFGLETISLRYFNVFGPRQDPKSQYAAAIPIFIHNAIDNKDIIIFGDGTQTRDFIFVKDVVSANILSALTKGVTGIFNVANGRSITILNLAEKIIEFTHSKSKIVFTKERPGDIKHSLAEISKTKNILGFVPSGNLDKELKFTIDYFSKMSNR